MQTTLCKILGIEQPIIQAPMGGAVGPALAAAVSNAGGLGMLVPWRADLATVRQHIRETRALTSKPFGVNLNLEFPQDERLEAALEEGVRVISLFWRDPAAGADVVSSSTYYAETLPRTDGFEAAHRQVVCAGRSFQESSDVHVTSETHPLRN